jgi:hypothetical protein
MRGRAMANGGSRSHKRQQHGEIISTLRALPFSGGADKVIAARTIGDRRIGREIAGVTPFSLPANRLYRNDPHYKTDPKRKMSPDLTEHFRLAPRYRRM